MAQKRRFAFTWNNYPTEKGKNKFGKEEEDEAWMKCLKDTKYKYIIIGKEVAPTTGTPHLQGYFEFKSGKRFDTIEKICKGIKLIPAKGNAKQNRDYCCKGEQSKEEWEEFGINGPNYGLNADTWEDGDMSEQGKRMDLEEAMSDIKSGMKELDFFETHPMVMFRYPKACDRYRILCEKDRMKGFNKKEVSVLWGETGTGKTRSAIELFPDAFIVSSTQTGLWWDGYDGEETVILDEFRDNAVGLSQLLRILDGYYCQVPIKGGSRTLCAKNIIITSNTNPQSWYHGCDKKSRLALFRRFDTILFFDSDGEIKEESRELLEPKRFNPMATDDY